MAVAAERALRDTRDAFDGVAAGYHAQNMANPLLRAMRRRALTTVMSWVPGGSRLLDLGCGPATDSVELGRAGYTVTAIDWSAAMVQEARHRVGAAGLR